MNGLRVRRHVINGVACCAVTLTFLTTTDFKRGCEAVFGAFGRVPVATSRGLYHLHRVSMGQCESN
jgi:hypothetical protein